MLCPMSAFSILWVCRVGPILSATCEYLDIPGIVVHLSTCPLSLADESGGKKNRTVTGSCGMISTKPAKPLQKSQ